MSAAEATDEWTEEDLARLERVEGRVVEVEAKLDRLIALREGETDE